jgi:hypothetical protein
MSKIIEFEKSHQGGYKIQELKEFIVSAPVKQKTVYEFWLCEIDLMKQSHVFFVN